MSPTHGHGFVFGRSVEHEMGTIQRLMGVCPQNDVLFEEMSAPFIFGGGPLLFYRATLFSF